MWTDRSRLNSREALETRIRELTARFNDGDRSDDNVCEIEVLMSAAFVDPTAMVKGGEISLSKAINKYLNSTAQDFKKVFSIPDYASHVDVSYALARHVVGNRVAEAIMEDAMEKTGDPLDIAIQVIERMVSPTSRFRPYAVAGLQQAQAASA